MKSIISTLGTTVRRFAASAGGSASLINTVIAIPMVVASGATAIDFGRVTRAKSHLQQIADGAALAAAAVSDVRGKSKREVIEQRQLVANAYLTQGLQGVDSLDLIGLPTVAVGPNTVDVAVKARVKSTLMNVLNGISTDSTNGKTNWNWDVDFSVSSKSGYLPERYLCLLSLHPTLKGAIYFQGNSEFMATCAVQANSDNAVAIQTWGNAYAYAYNFCAVGGWSGSGFQPNPVGGCKTKADPYDSMALPTPAASCDAAHTNTVVKNTTQALSPGTFCGGLSIKTHGVANLAPGLYILKNGPLSIDSQSTLDAPSGVLFYLTGNAAKVDVASGATVKLVGPNNTTAISSTQNYKGFAIMQDRQTAVGAVNTIASKGGVNITGAIYTPAQDLEVWANGDMNAESPFFPMVVRSLNMNGNATLYVNLDYTVAQLDEPGALKVPANVFVSQ